MLSPTGEAVMFTLLNLVTSALAFGMGVLWERENQERRLDNSAGEAEETPGPDPPPGDPGPDTTHP